MIIKPSVKGSGSLGKSSKYRAVASCQRILHLLQPAALKKEIALRCLRKTEVIFILLDSLSGNNDMSMPA